MTSSAHRLRIVVFLAGLTVFIAMSVNRFSDFAWSEHKLDVASQADNIGAPALQYLATRLPHASSLGCVSVNPEWLDACDNLWYSMLPYYVKKIPQGAEPAGYPYLIFVANPGAPATPEAQASHFRNYRVVDVSPRSAAVLLARSQP